jgi:hypothetical protein
MGWLGVAGNEARAMRMLENRLDKALLKANEARSVGHMYEEVSGRTWPDVTAREVEWSAGSKK